MADRLWSFEWLAVVYFTALGVAALFGWTSRRRPGLALLGAVGTVGGILVTTRIAPEPFRLWAPHAYLAIGYWLPVWLITDQPTDTFEGWLVRTDSGWRYRVGTVPRWAATGGELAYLACYALVPITFAVLWFRGSPADVERFWIAVLGAAFTCFGGLPWLTSRPPRGGHDAAGAIGRVNAALLSRLSHGLNTFPSGHVAVAVVVAGRALAVSWPAGVAVSAIAVGIALGAVTGRHHYAIDALLGAAVGLMALLISLGF
jgi:hypothetical protein